MCAFARRSAAVLFLVLLVPAAAFAQSVITGVFKDTSGAVLPGVTVEAALRRFAGTLVVVSHDRAFLDGVGVTRRLEVREGCVMDR